MYLIDKIFFMVHQLDMKTTFKHIRLFKFDIYEHLEFNPFSQEDEIIYTYSPFFDTYNIKDMYLKYLCRNRRFKIPHYDDFKYNQIIRNLKRKFLNL